MRKNPVKKAFTLIEIIIVLIIASVLIGVLFQVYRTIADVSVRVRYQKEVGHEVVQMQTILQNIIDTHSIDYTMLTGTARASSQGRTTTLPLISNDKQKDTIAISASGEVTFTTVSGSDSKTVSLLSNGMVLDNATFIITPPTDPVTESSFSNIYQPGVRIVGTLHAVDYAGVYFPIQTFYTFLQK